MLPMEHFRSRAFSAGNAAGFLLYSSIFRRRLLARAVIHTALGYSPLDAGLRMMPWTVTLCIVAPVAGALVNRVGERALTVGGMTLQGLGLLWIALLAQSGEGYAAIVGPLVVAGCGVSLRARTGGAVENLSLVPKHPRPPACRTSRRGTHRHRSALRLGGPLP
jgi:hypothetical protein